MTDLDILTRSLEQCAELDIDPTPEIYAHFFDICEGATDLMGHSDAHMRSRMVNQVFELLLDDALSGAGNYLRWEVDNHLSAYGVQVHMYPAFFEAVKHGVRNALGELWSDDCERAWDRRIDMLQADIDAHTAAHLREASSG